MACAGCEARREWIKQQAERAKQRMQLCMQRLSNPVSNPVDSKQSAAIEDDGSTEHSNGSDRRTEQ